MRPVDHIVDTSVAARTRRDAAGRATSVRLALRAGRDFRRDPLAFLAARGEWHDVIRFRAGLTEFTLVNHPELIRRILVFENDRYGEGKWTKRGKYVLGDSIITREGSPHRERRSLMAPSFERRRLIAHGPAMVRRVERLSESWREGDRIDAHEAMGRLAIAMAGDALFDADLEAEAAGLVEALGVLLRAISRLPLPRPRVLAARRHVAGVAARLTGGHMVPRLYEAGLSERQVVDEVISLLFAAVDTTPRALAFTWLMLGTHLDVEARLHEELSTVLGGRPPDVEDLGNLPRLRMVVDETLRMYPPVHFIDRRPLEDVVLADTTVRAGAYMLISPLVTQRDPRFFDEPAAFRPERWNVDARDPGVARLCFPFGAGAHGCLGEALARLEISLTLATLAQRWRLRPNAELPDEPSPQTLRFPMTLERRA